MNGWLQPKVGPRPLIYSIVGNNRKATVAKCVWKRLLLPKKRFLELTVRLSARETEMLSQIDSYQKNRRRTAWINLGMVFAFWAVLTYLDRMTDQLVGMFTILTIITLSTVMRVQFQWSSEDKLLDLLRRYVNRDAEAIKQMSTQKSPDADNNGM